MLVIFLLLSAILALSQIATVSAVVILTRRLQGAKDEVDSFIRFIFEPKGPEEGSVFTQFIDQTATVFGSHIGSSVQQAFKGALGGTMKGVNSALEEQAIIENPGLGALEYLPKNLKRNPLAIMGIQALVNKVLTSGTASGGPGAGANGNGHQMNFDL